MNFIYTKKEEKSKSLQSVIDKYEKGKLKDGDVVCVKAFIFNVRIKSKFSFVVIRDEKRIFQCFFSPEECAFDINTLLEESSVLITGKIVANSPSKINPGFEIAITNILVLSAPPEQPLTIYKSLQQLNWSDETIFDNRALTLRNPFYRAILKIGHGVLGLFRQFMVKEGFTEFVPPKIVAGGAEGGADMFSLDYFGKKAFLTQSPQQYKQAMVGVFSKVFCTSGVFRAEKHSTSRHINEFYGLDFEMGFIDGFQDIMATEARLLSYIIMKLNKDYKPELDILGVKLNNFTKIPAIKFSDIKEIIKNEYNREYRDENDLEPEEEKLIGKYFKEKFNSDLVFITHYPTVKRPFYTMDNPENERESLSFDLLLNGAEITTGGQRIHDYSMQINKMKKLGLNPDSFTDYLAMLKFGLPPHGGLGLGLERLLMKLLNLTNIKYAAAFPRDRDRLVP